MAPPPGWEMAGDGPMAAGGYTMAPQMVMMPMAAQPHPQMAPPYVSPQMVVSAAPMGLPVGAEAGAPPLWGNLAALAKAAQGSRYLQAALPRMSASELARARDELAPSLYELSRHTFGNYLVTQLLGLPAHLGFGEALAAAIKGHVVDLIKHVHGSRVVQNALVLRGPGGGDVDGPLRPNPAVSDEDAAALVAELDGRLLETGLDTHGSWGVCAAFARTRAPFILEQVAKHLGALATS